MVPADKTLTFEHTYTWWGNLRKLKVTAQPNVTLTASHVPRRCRGARTVLLGPLTPRDMDAASFVMQPGKPSCTYAPPVLTPLPCELPVLLLRAMFAVGKA